MSALYDVVVAENLSKSSAVTKNEKIQSEITLKTCFRALVMQ